MAAKTATKQRSDECLGNAEFSGTFAQTWKRTREKGEPVSLLLIDLDGLQTLNEQHGHEQGDRAIDATIGALAKVAKRDGWTLGRIGGDEFALLAPGVATETAFLRADAIRRDLDAALAKAITQGEATASIGVASSPRDARSADDLMRKADLALYSAKDQGGRTVALTPGDDMVLKSSYYSTAQLGRLKRLAERMKKKEAVLLREALDDLLRKYERS